MQTNLGHPAAIAPTLSLQRNVGQNKHLRIAITSDSSVSNISNQFLRILWSIYRRKGNLRKHIFGVNCIIKHLICMEEFEVMIQNQYQWSLNLKWYMGLAFYSFFFSLQYFQKEWLFVWPRLWDYHLKSHQFNLERASLIISSILYSRSLKGRCIYQC